MRILRLDLAEGSRSVDFHPLVSVLQGLEHAQTEGLTRAVRSLTKGSSTGGIAVTGLVEHAGELLELGRQPIALGPMTTEDVVVMADGLLDGDTERVHEELVELRRTVEIDAVKLEEVRADLDPTAAARVFVLRQRLGLDGDPQDSALLDRLRAVDETLRQVQAVPETVAEVPDEVAALIEEWDEYVARREQAKPRLETLTARVTRAEAALTRARTAVMEAEQDAQPLLLTGAEEDRLEFLTNPTSRKRRKQGLTEDEAAEVETLLAKVNMPSYTAYVVHRLSPTPPAEKQRAYEDAVRDVQQAEHEVAESRIALQQDEVVSQLEADHEMLRREAQTHLGPMLPYDLGAALAALVVEVENPAWLDALRSLYRRMLDNHIDIPDDIAPESLVGFAEDWLAEERSRLGIDNDGVDPAELGRALAEAEGQFLRHNRAMVRLDQIETAIAASNERLRSLEARVDHTISGDDLGVDTLVDAVSDLGLRLRGQNPTSVPILVVGEFDCLGDDDVNYLMGQLELVGQHHQVVIITSDDRVARWVTEVGARRALLSSLGDARSQPNSGAVD